MVEHPLVHPLAEQQHLDALLAEHLQLRRLARLAAAACRR
jgi:hypothetical protein